VGKRGVFALLLAVLVIGGCAIARTGHRAGSQREELRAADIRPAVVESTPTPPKPVNHCAGNTDRQLVLVSIADQHAWMCARGRTVYSTAVTTGMAGRSTATPTGHYRIQGLNRDTVLLPDTGERYHVRYWIPFDAPDYGFHDAGWQHFPFGSAEYKTAGSHGCVHLPLKSIKFLYHWARVGAAVTIKA
jgi:lipoprotein-anchoring transpeptidase ErfK/SrfK